MTKKKFEKFVSLLPVMPKDIPAIDMPKQTKNCSTCKFLRYEMCPFFGAPKDNDNITISDNKCAKHAFTITGEEF